jgi:hypothetical protein
VRLEQSSDRPRYIFVVELDRTLPRREPSKPHVYVGISVEDPETRFARLASGKVNSQFSGQFVRLRPDLNPLNREPLSTDAVQGEVESLKEGLARAGHAVNGDAKVWNCYVVDLEPPTGMTDFGKGYVYVGQSQWSPEERFAIHKGERPLSSKHDLRSRIVHRRGIALNKKLMSSLLPAGPFFTQKDALQAERQWALELDRRGYRVEAGDATPSRNRGKESSK